MSTVNKQSFSLKKNQTKLIPILLDSVPMSFPPSIMVEGKLQRESRAKENWIPDQVGNDKKIEVVLGGENARVEVVGLVLGKGDEQRSLDLNIVHAAPGTKSEVKVRSVLRGRSTFSFRGNVRIEKGAKGADAYLRSDALLFDEAKMGDDTPALEILEPDVKAGHAATIGKVDEQMLFYLMSRGLSIKEAEEMLIEGFVEPIKDVIARNVVTRQSKREIASLRSQ